MKLYTGRMGAVALATLIGIASLAAWADNSIPTTPEPGGFKIGTEPWLGYGQWDVADAKGFFKEHGLENVQLVNFTQDKDLNAALASGQIDGANVATHTAMVMAAAGLPIKIVMLLDFSLKADAIISVDVNSVSDMKGKSVAFEEGTTSDILINYALQKNGMTIADVKKVPMPAADAGTALIAGRVPVAVTYEPYLTTAMRQNAKAKLIFTAGEDPGLISDVFVVRQDVLEKRPGQVLALLKSWDEALTYYRAHMDDGQAIIAKVVGDTPENLKTAFDGVRFYSLAENQQHLTTDFTTQTAADVMASAKKAGILSADVDVPSLIDGRFLKAATQ
jgi:NitT/TauT family transport system substrate-binding protein